MDLKLEQDDPGGLRLCSARIILAFSLILTLRGALKMKNLGNDPKWR